MAAQPESTWSAPSDWCPHPEHWHSESIDATEQEVTDLIGGLVRGLQPELVVETGTEFGRTAAAIGVCLTLNGHGRLITLEVDEVKVGIATRLMRGLPVDVLIGRAEELVPTAPIDFLFLDSGFDCRGRELEHFAPHLSPGAIVAIHDAGEGRTVWDTITPTLEGGSWTGLRLRTPRGLALLQRR